MKKQKQKYRNGKTTGCPTKTFGHDRCGTGFTLVELVIVIAIVIILSVISVPIYRGYVDKSKMAEGYALLGTILSAQKAYYSQYGNFLKLAHSSAGLAGENYSCNDSVLGIDGRGNKYFTLFCVSGGGGVGADARRYFNAIAYKPSDLINNDNNDRLALQYNITKGAKIVDYPVDFDSNWTK